MYPQLNQSWTKISGKCSHLYRTYTLLLLFSQEHGTTGIAQMSWALSVTKDWFKDYEMISRVLWKHGAILEKMLEHPSIDFDSSSPVPPCNTVCLLFAPIDSTMDNICFHPLATVKSATVIFGAQDSNSSWQELEAMYIQSWFCSWPQSCMFLVMTVRGKDRKTLSRERNNYRKK